MLLILSSLVAHIWVYNSPLSLILSSLIQFLTSGQVLPNSSVKVSPCLILSWGVI